MIKYIYHFLKVIITVSMLGWASFNPQASSNGMFMMPGTSNLDGTPEDGSELSIHSKEANLNLLLYDDFNNPAYDGAFNPSLWYFAGESFYNVRQENGSMVFSNSTSPSSGDGILIMKQPESRTLEQITEFEADLKISSDHSGGYGFVKIQIMASGIVGREWWTQCRLGSWSGSNPPEYICDVYTYLNGTFYPEYATAATLLNFDTWYTAKIEVNPETAQLHFFLNSALVGTYIPVNANELKVSATLQPRIGVWNNAAGVYATRYVDNVKIAGVALPAPTPVLVDDFNDDSINPSLWWAYADDFGPAAAERNQRLEVNLPAGSSGVTFGAGVQSIFRLRGDFDVEVDYSLLSWPTSSGVRVGLSSKPPNNDESAQRTGFGTSEFEGYPREVYLTDFRGEVSGIRATTDLAGKLRIIRKGYVWSSYYFDPVSGYWVAIYSGYTSNDDVSIGLNVWSHDSVFGQSDALIAYDNFTVYQGKIIFPCDRTTDYDSDGLFDGWESCGYTHTDGSFINLPAMGADPLIKDIFVEIDYMYYEGWCLPVIGCYPGHSHQPWPQAIKKVVDAFKAKGINLHVDNGSNSIMNPTTGKMWENASRSNSVPHDNDLGSSCGQGCYNWKEFDAIKSRNFSEARHPIFHYVIFADNLGGFQCTSGISRNNINDMRLGASDFIVSLGTSCWEGTISEQAGTFMHELGHNLGLRHGGDSDLPNFKPNYLSVMNYGFQTSGLLINNQEGNFDYSNSTLPPLVENNLDETVGLNGGLLNYGTRYWCGMDQDRIDFTSNAVDWSCNGSEADKNVQANVNEGPNWAHNTSPTETLQGYDDWDNIVFTGGSVGDVGATRDIPLESTFDEITAEEDASLTTLYEMALSGGGNIALPPGATFVYTFTLTNKGMNSDIYHIIATSSQGWADLSNAPATVSLAPGINREIIIEVNVPTSPMPAAFDELVLWAKSDANPSIEDAAVGITRVMSKVFLPVLSFNP